MRWPGGEKSIGSDVPADPVKRGFYLATLAHCMECHSHKPDGTPDFVNSWGKGGHEMKGAFGSVIASNILSHNEKGVGVGSDDELRRALIEGKGRDGRAFKQPMARHVYFSKMTVRTSTPSSPGCGPFRRSNRQSCAPGVEPLYRRP